MTSGRVGGTLRSEAATSTAGSGAASAARRSTTVATGGRRVPAVAVPAVASPPVAVPEVAVPAVAGGPDRERRGRGGRGHAGRHGAAARPARAGRGGTAGRPPARWPVGTPAAPAPQEATLAPGQRDPAATGPVVIGLVGVRGARRPRGGGGGGLGRHHRRRGGRHRRRSGHVRRRRPTRGGGAGAFGPGVRVATAAEARRGAATARLLQSCRAPSARRTGQGWSSGRVAGTAQEVWARPGGNRPVRIAEQRNDPGSPSPLRPGRHGPRRTSPSTGQRPTLLVARAPVCTPSTARSASWVRSAAPT